MSTIILFIVVLSILVFVHEFGHFIAARKAGMKVYEFAIGFPPLLIGVYKDPKTKKFVWVRGKRRNAVAAGGGKQTQEEQEYPATLYSLNMLPLGGFCKIKGENGEEMNDSDSFGYQKIWKKILVLIAGVVMNIVLAAVLLSIGFMIGLPSDVSRGVPKGAVLVNEPALLIQATEPGSAASDANLDIQPGDSLRFINGMPVTTVADVVAAVQGLEGQPVELRLVRGDIEQIKTIVPTIIKEGESARLGLLLSEAAMVRYPWYSAIWQGFSAAMFGLAGIFVSFFLLIKNLMFGTGMALNVAGPVGIATIIGQSADLGIQYLINVTAMISLSLAAINILPIPALDGGRLLFVLIEGVSGKKVPLRYEQTAHTIGFVLLLLLLVVVTIRDIGGLLL